jgi:hypothetical protein
MATTVISGCDKVVDIARKNPREPPGSQPRLTTRPSDGCLVDINVMARSWRIQAGCKSTHRLTQPALAIVCLLTANFIDWHTLAPSLIHPLAWAPRLLPGTRYPESSREVR